MSTFKPQNLDFKLSPYTGLTREHWIEAGKYLLTGIFNNIKDFNDPVVMPRKETEITYPHKWAEGGRLKAEERAEIFEGLTRSMFIAAPIIHIDKDLTINGINIRDYYKSHILRICTKGDSVYVSDYEDLQKENNSTDPFRPYQQTVETSALVICLYMCEEEIWDTYTKDEKDVIANFLLSFAHASTVPQNWRLFNMLDMAFLKRHGYEIDEEIMLDHANAILHYYASDGWYRDGHSFDYYSCWAFNVYAPIWNVWYGYEHLPYIAHEFEEKSNKLMETYADFFDSKGFTNMWGRSNIYRFAATSAFDANLMLKNSKANPGLSRRIMSGSLMQFLSREDFLYKGVPTLGFYGQFSPLVQGYSCAESPFWMGKAFLCLHLPKEHPFWTSTENNGTWDKLEVGEVKETMLDGPALCFTNHEANGETILRTAKVVKDANDIHGMWNYSKLCYNTQYPWESTAPNNIESQQYVLRDITTDEISRANVTFHAGIKDGVYYRRQYFKYNNSGEAHWLQGLNLADFPVKYGIMRVDGLKLHRRPVELKLGAYGFADNGTEIITKQKGDAKAIILKGYDATGCEKQLAMTIYDGFEEISYIKSEGTNPDSLNSIIVYATAKRNKHYGGYEKYVMISQVITKESHEDFNEEDIFPIKEISYTDETKCGAYGDVVVTLVDGRVRKINFEGIEGKLSL